MWFGKRFDKCFFFYVSNDSEHNEEDFITVIELTKTFNAISRKVFWPYNVRCSRKKPLTDLEWTCPINSGHQEGKTPMCPCNILIGFIFLCHVGNMFESVKVLIKFEYRIRDVLYIESLTPPVQAENCSSQVICSTRS